MLNTYSLLFGRTEVSCHQSLTLSPAAELFSELSQSHHGDNLEAHGTFYMNFPFPFLLPT